MKDKDQESNENWQLEEGDQVDDRWVLRESEQQFAEQWELNQAAEGDSARDWQPVDNDRPERSGLSWVLPILITVFLLALIGYSGFILLPQIINPGDPQPIVEAGVTPEPNEEGSTPEDVLPPDPDLDETEPTDSDLPDSETPTDVEQPITVDPTPAPDTEEQPQQPVAPQPPAQPAVFDQDFATVITTYGVNSRSEPNADAPVVRVLNQGESFFLFGSPAEGWLEILVTDEDVELVQGEPIQGQVAYAASEFFDIEPQPIMRPFYEDIMAFAGRLPEEPELDDEGVEDGDDPLADLLVPTPSPDGASPDADPPVETEPAQARVDSEAGLNVRSEPDTTGNILTLLNQGDTVPALALSDDGLWVQVELEDGLIGWLFAEFVTVLGDLSAAQPTAPVPALAPVVIDATQVMTSGIVPPAPYSSIIPGDTPAVVVAVAAGAIGRVQPNAAAEELTLLPQGAALTAVGRTADGQWIQVEMPDGNLTAWVSRAVVSVTPDIDTLPIDGVAPDADADDETPETPETPILLPTPTPAPDSDTETPTPDATTGDVVGEAVVRDILLGVYAEPDSDSENVAFISRNTRLPVSGRNADGDWVQVVTEDGDAGWIPVRSVILNPGINALPVVEP